VSKNGTKNGTKIDFVLSDDDGNNADAASYVSPVPTGLRLVMMGDSLTRYQYMSLVYFLRNGIWINPNETNQNFVREKSFSSWNNYFNVTTSALAPMEYCDCFRPANNNLDNSVENRYFYDKARDNRVIYLLAYGHKIPMHGRWNSSTAMSLLSGPRQEGEAARGLTQPSGNNGFAWQFADWKEAIEAHVSGFGAKHLLFNAGVWPNQFHEPETFLNFTESLIERGIQPIWKSTTYSQNHMLGGILARKTSRRDARIWRQMCGKRSSKIPNATLQTWCVDLGWTRNVNSSRYWDRLHFVEPVYRVMNEELLELLGHPFPPNYTKQQTDELMGTS